MDTTLRKFLRSQKVSMNFTRERAQVSGTLNKNTKKRVCKV